MGEYYSNAEWIDNILPRLDKLEGHIERIDGRCDDIKTLFDTLGNQIKAFGVEMDRIEKKFDEKFKTLVGYMIKEGIVPIYWRLDK